MLISLRYSDYSRAILLLFFDCLKGYAHRETYIINSRNVPIVISEGTRSQQAMGYKKVCTFLFGCRVSHSALVLLLTTTNMT